MGSMTCMPPSSYAGTGACQKPVHADVRPWAQCHGSVALENQEMKCENPDKFEIFNETVNCRYSTGCKSGNLFRP